MLNSENNSPSVLEFASPDALSNALLLGGVFISCPHFQQLANASNWPRKAARYTNGAKRAILKASPRTKRLWLSVQVISGGISWNGGARYLFQRAECRQGMRGSCCGDLSIHFVSSLPLGVDL
jgi:hypothetical protein